MKTCLALTSLAAFSLFWLSPAQYANAAVVGLTPSPTSANDTPGSVKSQAQVETATAVGTITSSGNAKVTLKSAAIDGGAPLVFLVPVTKDDTSSIWADKVRTALRADLQVAELFEIGGTGSSITLTRKAQLVGEDASYYAANDATLNLALENDTAIGITTATSSENTTAGFLASTAQVETAKADGTITTLGNARVIVTAAGLIGSPKIYNVPVLLDDVPVTTFTTATPPAVQKLGWADKVRAVLKADSNLTSLYDVGGDGTASITLTRKKETVVSGIDVFAANDPTLNINIDNDTCAGITPQSISTNTMPGALQNVGQVETATALGAVTTSGDLQVVLTSADLVGSQKLIQVPVLAGDSTSAWATKVRTALNGDTAVSSLFTVSGEGSKIILSRNADIVSPGLSIYPDNDPTLNLSLFTGSKGIGSRLTSTNTTAGELSSIAQVEVATAAGTISKNGTLEVKVTAAGLPGSPKSINIPVLAGDTASAWAEKVRTAFNADPDITNLFAVGGTGDRVTLTSKSVQTLDGVVIYPTNDPTLNIALVIDSDRDNLADFDEIYETLGYKTNPNDPDTDRDGFSDSIEIAEGTNPTLSTSKPNIALALYNVPDITNDPVDISIDGTFQPFGNRPATDKSSEDGSVTVRDQNGVIIWADNFGRAIPIPDSSLAKTLYVSNTECAIWQNRFDGTFSSRGSTTQIVLYRRDENGAAIPSPVISIPGTVLETSSVSPSTYGWTFVVSDTFDSGSLESRQRYESGSTNTGATYAIRDVNAWHDRRLTLYRLTWDNKLQTLSSTSYNVPVSYNNTGGIDVLGNGSDGALFVTDTIGYETYDNVDDPFPGVFLSQNIGTWVITTQDKEKIYRAISSAGLGESPTAVAHVSNSRLLFETDQVTSTTTFKVRDFRARADGTIAQDTVFDLPAGERLLPVAKFTRAGLPIIFYTSENQNQIRLYPADASAPYAAGSPVTLPNRFLSGSAYVRNPRDNSLLLQMETRELVWVPGDSSTPAMNAPVVLPNSSKAEPMFVSERQAVAWMNGNAPIEITSSGASLPVAEIHHFDRSLSATNLTALSDIVRMPIEGRFVAAPPSLTPDPEREGWFISTFTKNASRSATMRTYQLFTVLTIDNDKDGIADNDEMIGTFGYTTDFLNPDSDGDGLSDAEELLPYEFVNTLLGWEAARSAAIAKGGKLAVLDTTDKQNRFKAAIISAMKKAKTSGNLWIGGHDTLTEGQIRWLTTTGLAEASGALVAAGSTNWQPYQPNNIGEADAMEASSSTDFKWAMAPVSRSQAYVIQYHTSNPNIADTDGDGLSDSEERPLQGDPNIIDTDGDGLTDREENTAGTSLVLVDTDGDELSDRDELYRYEFVRPSLARPSLSWEDARLAAIAEGGKLAVLDSADAQGHFKAAMIKAAASGNIWIGGHDRLVEGEIRWLTRDGLIDPRGDLVAAPAYTNWQVSQPNNIGEADAMEASSADDFKWAMAPGSKVQAYAIEYYPLNPNSKDTDNDGIEDNDEIYLGTDPLDDDTDDDNLKDGEELSLGTDPKSKDSDADGLDDDKEVLVHLTDPNEPDSDGDGIDDYDEVTAGTDANDPEDPFIKDNDGDGLTNFDEIFVHFTDPNKADTDGDGINDDVEIANGGDPIDAESDTDGDGLKDRVETNTRVFVSAANTGTDPYNRDTDGDGLEDKVETFTRIYLSPSNTGTDPNYPDTDVDGLTDGEEINGFGPELYTSNPFTPDSDGDLVSDYDEVNAVPPTDPKDGTSYPTGVAIFSQDLHSTPSMLNDAEPVSIEDAFSPFGHRPDSEKTGEDGSVGLRDRNGVIVWIDNEGVAITLEDSSLAKILYVSNSECVVYNNRYAADYNARGSSSEVVIYRREGGVIKSSPPIILPGTLNDTAPVTPNTYGFTLMTSSVEENGNDSKQRVADGVRIQDGVQIQLYRTDDVDVWDRMYHRLYRVTWNGDKQDIATTQMSVPNNMLNLGDNKIVGFGSDGAFAFTQTVANDFFDDVDDSDPKIFKTATQLVWVNWNPNQEGFQINRWVDWFNPTYGPAAPKLNVAYVSNERLLFSEQLWTTASPFASTDNYILKDYRRSSDNSVSLINTYPLAAGDKPLGITSTNRKGLTPFLYVLNKEETSLKLYRVVDSLELLGGAVSLPAKLNENLPYVRNPIDGSLLIRTQLPTSAVWITGTLDEENGDPLGLESAQVIPRSFQAMPHYVSGTEAVLWMNHDAPLAAGGVIAPASMSHFQIKGGRVVETTLTPPIQGRFVMNPTTLTPDPESEGWYVTTFEKSGARTALIRMYRLTKTSDVDRDGDGLADLEELFYGTNPGNPDTDGDGLSDGEEVLPYELINNNKAWEDARIEAISKGGRLVVLDTASKQEEFAKSPAGKSMSSSLWIGGHDSLIEGRYLWLNDKGELEDSTSLLVNKSGGFKNWAINGITNEDKAYGMEAQGGPDFKWSMGGSSKLQGYVIEYPKSDPLDSDSDKDGLSDGVERSFSSNPILADSDGDGLNDKSEYDSKPKSKPYLIDTDGDGLDDYEEVVTYKSNPTLVDTEGDGLSDSEEKTAGTSLVLVDSDSDGYSDYQELKATPPTDPNDSTKFPPGGSVPRGWITGVESANSSTTISVPVGWTPFGQRIDYTKWGDDGSRVYADASGMLLWKTSNGSIRPVPNSDKAVPLIVSNSKIIVWHNAYNNQADTPRGNGDGISPIEVYLYRLDGLGNVDPVPMIISNADSQKILGYDIIATAPVTTTSHAYHLVTAGAPKDSKDDGGLSYSIYRITFEGDVQAISTINSDEGGAEDREMARAYGHGSDGSLVFYTLDEARPPEDRPQDAYWVDSARRATTTGVWEELHTNVTNEPGALGSRVLYTSGTRVVYETVAQQSFFEIWRLSRYGKLVTVDTWYNHGLNNGDIVEIRNVISYENPTVDPNGKFAVEVISPSKFQYYLLNDNPLNVRESYDEYAATYARVGERSYPIVDARRNPYTGFGAMDNVDISPGGDYYRFLQISTQTMEGDVRYCYALNKLKNSVNVYRLNNLGFQLVYTAKLPTGLLLDETATVEKINPADGSAVITSDNIDNIIWVQKTSDVEPTRNAIVIPGSRLAKTMFVDGKEMVVWNNAYDGPLSSGLLAKAKILHYRHTNGLLEPAMDLSSRIQGTFVMSTPIFVPAKEEWEFSTVEKTVLNQAVIRNYRFTDNEMSDSDNDGIPDSVELAVHKTNPLSADTDGDGISDKDELTYGADPNKADTDGDGVSDYDEIYVLFTDPTVPSFGTSTSVVNYNNAKGLYQGMVLNDVNGLTYHLSLSVTAKGSFSGTIQGAFGSMAVKGSLNATGSASITLTNLGVIDISMRPTGSTYMITGELESTAGDYQFALRRAKTNQVAERLTFTAALLSDGTVSIDSEIERHTGAAVAAGSVAKNGKVAFQIYNPDGTLAAYAGSVLESASNNGVISLFARNKQGSVLMGNMILVPNGLTKNKLQGDLKFLANDGINQDREVAGATFVPPTVGTLPLSSFRFGSNNMIMNYVDGTFDGVYKVATLMPTGVSVPLTENESAKTTYDRKTGLMKAVYTLTDATRQLSKATSTAYAVTVDGYDDMIGMYMDSASTGLFSVAPNSDNLPPVGSYGKTKYAAALSSAARDIPKAGQSYSISVAATGDWKVVIPPDVNWVSVIITNDITPETPPTNYSPLSGNGNATVTISVAPNSTGGVRQATITIGGAPHKIRQARY